MNQFQFEIQSTSVVSVLLFHRETSFHEMIFDFSKTQNDSPKFMQLSLPLFKGDPFKLLC